MLSNSDDDIKYAAELIKNGEVVGMPTETVYGLAADATNPEAVKKIFEAKGRPSDNPLIVHICDASMMEEIACEIPKLAYKSAERFWPGPLTMVLPKRIIIPKVTSGGLETVGVRLPSDETARKLISYSGKPIAAPSANLSGSPSPTTAAYVYADMNGRIPAIIDGGSCNVGVESTVISFENDAIRLLRPGYVSVEMLSEVTENIIIDKGVLEQLALTAKVSSPGMKYKHYSPKAEIYIIKGNLSDFEKYVSENLKDDDAVMIFDCDELSLDVKTIMYGRNSEQQAKRLFSALRECDEIGADRVFARCPSTEGVGLAVYNRLLRAAAFRVIEV